MSENAQVLATQTTEIDQTQNPAASPAATPQAKPDDMAARFAALAKRDRQVRMGVQQAKAREAELSRREQLIAEREQSWESEFKQSPLEALKKRGYSYQDLTNAALNDGKFQPETEIKSVKDEISKLRQEQADKEKKSLEDAKTAQQQAESETITAFKDKIVDYVDKNAEKYELIKLYDSQELVFSAIEEHYNRTNKILSIDEACALTEGYIENEIDRTARESKKFQSKYLAQNREEPRETSGKSSTTLNNGMQSSAAPSMLSPKVEEDRMKRALAKLQGTI